MCNYLHAAGVTDIGMNEVYVFWSGVFFGAIMGWIYYMIRASAYSRIDRFEFDAKSLEKRHEKLIDFLVKEGIITEKNWK